MKYTTLIKSTLAATAILLSGVNASAQALPAEIEGSVSAITSNLDGSATMTVMGMTVNVPVGTFVSTPSASLTLAQLADPAPLPNRTEAGFTGGTAIVTGTVAPSGVITADDVFVEPAENVILGVITANNAGALSINTVPIVMLNDARIPALPVRDVNGVVIIPASIPVGTRASAAGYFANGVFNAFLVEAGAGTPVNQTPQVTITLAIARERNANRGDDVEVRGSVTTFHVATGVTTQTVRIFRVDGTTQTLLGTATATLDPLTPGVAEWRFRVTTPVTNNPVLSLAPTTVRVVNISAGANNTSATSPVAVR